jgi:hypothetical protein
MNDSAYWFCLWQRFHLYFARLALNGGGCTACKRVEWSEVITPIETVCIFGTWVGVLACRAYLCAAAVPALDNGMAWFSCQFVLIVCCFFSIFPLPKLPASPS